MHVHICESYQVAFSLIESFVGNEVFIITIVDFVECTVKSPVKLTCLSLACFECIEEHSYISNELQDMNTISRSWLNVATRVKETTEN
jgi:hypothetical protein